MTWLVCRSCVDCGGREVGSASADDLEAWTLQDEQARLVLTRAARELAEI